MIKISMNELNKTVTLKLQNRLFQKLIIKWYNFVSFFPSTAADFFKIVQYFVSIQFLFRFLSRKKWSEICIARYRGRKRRKVFIFIKMNILWCWISNRNSHFILLFSHSPKHLCFSIFDDVCAELLRKLQSIAQVFSEKKKIGICENFSEYFISYLTLDCKGVIFFE